MTPLDAKFIRILSVCGAVITFMLFFTGNSGTGFGLLGVFLFALFPYLLSFFLSFRMPQKTIARKIIVALVGFAVVGGLLVYVDDRIIELGAQSGFSFLVIPMYQLVLIGIACVIIIIFGEKIKKET